ncbi:MAG: molybdenum cofactor guanylyltransferase [Flavobacteriales bacterium]|nr:molybdenum cofactor guanylyltransferase [Flavobacteriales bacterium]
MMVSLAAIILAGGFSSRMGMDKGLVPFRGKPMIQWSIEVASSVTDHIMIIANQVGYEQFGHPVHHDLLIEKGPLGGIHAGLTYSNAVNNLVLACDLPMLNSAFIQHLVSEISVQHNIVVPRVGNRLEPLCAVYHQDCLSKIENVAQSEDLSLQGFLANSNTKFIDLDQNSPNYSPYLFSNINSKEELELLENIKQ